MSTDKIEELRRKISRVLAGGSENARARHAAAGKMMVRERLKLLNQTGHGVLHLQRAWPSPR